MNETRLGDLVADVQKALELAYDTGWECGTGDVMREVTAGQELASVIVQKVAAARDAEIREALLSKAAIEAGAKAVRALDWEVDEVGFFPTTEDVARVSLKAALTAITAPTGDHIGLHGDETGGQGR